ncbi:hypothetical protein BDV19DRAFT_402213 [Aspergillus venezuelensis]
MASSSDSQEPQSDPQPDNVPQDDQGREQRNLNETRSTTSTSILSRERWRTAAHAVYDYTGRLADRVGRPQSHTEAGLGASMVDPERLGATDDDQLADIFRNNGPGRSNTDQYERAVQAQAERLMQGLHAGGGSSPNSGATTIAEEKEEDVEAKAHAPAPSSLPGGILSALLQLQNRPHDSTSGSSSESEKEITLTPATTNTPRPVKPPKWYQKSQQNSVSSLVQSSMSLSQVGASTTSVNATIDKQKDGKKKKKKRKSNTKKDDKEVKLTVHIAEVIFRQRYIMQLCRAFMRYGAPTHRLEEYMQMTARVLDVPAQFMYLPGCMIMSFDDPVTRTAEVKLIRVPQGLDLGRLSDVHQCYKRVTHDMVDMQTAIKELTELMDRKPRYNTWLVILLYGLGSSAVAPFAFTARPIDMPIIFFLGCCLGFMQHVLAPRSPLYSNIFEVSAAILISFFARAFGSIRLPGRTDPIFCYASITESSIALILPGFSVLTSSLELQSHQMIAGSIRLVYTILYSLFLGYGVTVGTTIYGAIDSNATSDTTCARQDVWGSEYTQRFPFVALYCLIAALINQAKWRQVPIMVLIGTAGYVTNYFSTERLGSSSEVANTVGAFTIGFLANLYSRIWHGNAVSSTIPGIFCLVPSGLATSGSILSAIEYSDSVKNGTANTSGGTSGSSLTSLGFGMIQTAIGITVGLFVSALLVYPQGKKRSGLFSL